jgi:uncharacterized protein involved in outer membrane biogenesis
MPSEAINASVSGWRRVLLIGGGIVAGFLAVLMLVAAAIVVLRIDVGFMKPQIARLISDELGRDVRINGGLSLRVGADVEFIADNVIVANEGWAGTRPMVTLARVEGAVTAISLLLDPLHLRRLEADDVAVRLVVNEARQANWAFPEDEPSWLDRWGDPEAPTIIETLDLRNVDVSVALPDLEKPVSIVIASIGHAVRDEQLKSSINGLVNGIPLAFDGQIGPRSAVRGGGEVRFDYAGTLGEIEFDASGLLDDIENPQRPAIEVSLKGPNVEYLLNLLNAGTITQGPLDVRMSVARGRERIDARAAGRIGEFTIDAEGFTSDVDIFRDAGLSYSADGPSLGHVGRLFAFDRLPDLPFRATGGVRKQGEQLIVEATRLEIDDAEFTLSGEMSDVSRPTASDLVLRARGDDIARFRQLLGVTGILEGPFNLTATVTPSGGVHGQVRIDGVIDDIRHDVTLYPSGEDDLAGSRAEFDIRGPSFDELMRAADIDGMPDLAYRISGRAEYRVDTMRLDELSIELGSTTARISGDVDLDYPGSATDVRVAVASPDIGALLEAFGAEDVPSAPLDYESRLQLGKNLLRITDLGAELADVRIAGTVSLTLEPIASPVTFELDIDAGRFSDLLPANDRLDPADLPVSAAVSGSFSGERLELIDSRIAIGDARIVIDGVIDRPPTLSATDLTIDASIPRLASLGTGRRMSLPEESATLTGTFTGDGNRVTGRNVTMRLGENIIDTEFIYTAADVPSIRFRLASESLDLRPFLPAPGDDGDEPAVSAPKDRLIPDVELPIEVLDVADVDAELNIKRLVTHRAEYYDVGLAGQIANGNLDIGHFGTRGRVGRIDGTLAYRRRADEGVLDLTMTGENVSFAPQGLPVDEVQKRPTYNIDVDLSGTGKALRRLLATLDGRVLVHSGGGVMPRRSSWLINMFFGDFATEVLDTVNPLTKTSNDINLACAVLMLQVDDGVISGDPAIVAQVPKLHIFARGSVDLDTETIDIDFNTHVRKGLGFSVGDLVNPVTKIGGTLARPMLTIDEEGALIEGGAAIATAGLSVIARNLHQRFLADSEPCDTALESYRKAVESYADQ